MKRLVGSLFLFCAVLSADVTLRYKMELKSPMPQMTQAMQSMPMGTTIRVKGTRSLTEMMGMVFSVDAAKPDTLLVLDNVGKRYAEIKLTDLAANMKAAMPQVPPEAAAMMASMKLNVTGPKLSGRTATIQGIEAQEQDVELAVEGPAMPNMPAGPLIRLVMHVWNPKPGELDKSAGLKELAAYTKWASVNLKSNQSVEAMLAGIPGMGDSIKKLMDSGMSAAGPQLRMQMEMFMPAMAAMAAAGGAPAGMDPNGPLMTMTQDIAELSMDPIPDSAFQTPQGYTKAPFEELLKSRANQPGGAPGK